ncbi:hypothetical protein [Ruegeria sediminis]|nr:hypothetical protein [Ruegeria sediminis]
MLQLQREWQNRAATMRPAIGAPGMAGVEREWKTAARPPKKTPARSGR